MIGGEGQVLTSAGRVKLTQALRASKAAMDKVGEPWRLKRMKAAALVALATEVGINVPAVVGKAPPAHGLGDFRAPRKPVDHNPVHHGPLRGRFEFPLEIGLLGRAVIVTARVSWGYSPEWEHVNLDKRGRLESGKDAMSYSLEVLVEHDDGDYLDDCGHLLRAKPKPRWRDFSGLLEVGLLPDALHDEIVDRIEAEAHRVDQSFRKMTEGRGWKQFVAECPEIDDADPPRPPARQGSEASRRFRRWGRD
ncbi:MAG: hypothetical protein ACOVOE_00835 [Caulobacter sp.]